MNQSKINVFIITDIACGKPLRPIITSQATTPDRTLCLPEDINDISDTHKQLLLGVIPVAKPPTFKAKKIVIYICAADAEGNIREISLRANYCGYDTWERQP